MPWLAATALLHSSIVAEKRDTLKAWTILLAIIAFSFSLLGTFIVRSGVLISVHSFASDPSRGLYILMLLIFFTGGALLLFAKKASHLKSGSLFQPLSREGALVINNIIFASGGKSFIRTVQSIGRGLRKHDSKDKLIIFDICDQLNYGIAHCDKRKSIYDKEKILYKEVDIS